MAIDSRSHGSKNYAQRMEQLYIVKNIDQDNHHLKYYDALRNLAADYENRLAHGKPHSERYDRMLERADKYLAALEKMPTNPTRARAERMDAMEEQIIRDIRKDEAQRFLVFLILMRQGWGITDSIDSHSGAST